MTVRAEPRKEKRGCRKKQLASGSGSRRGALLCCFRQPPSAAPPGPSEAIVVGPRRQVDLDEPPSCLCRPGGQAGRGRGVGAGGAVGSLGCLGREQRGVGGRLADRRVGPRPPWPASARAQRHAARARSAPSRRPAHPARRARATGRAARSPARALRPTRSSLRSAWRPWPRGRQRARRRRRPPGRTRARSPRRSPRRARGQATAQSSARAGEGGECRVSTSRNLCHVEVAAANVAAWQIGLRVA